MTPPRLTFMPQITMQFCRFASRSEIAMSDGASPVGIMTESRTTRNYRIVEELATVRQFIAWHSNRNASAEPPMEQLTRHRHDPIGQLGRDRKSPARLNGARSLSVAALGYD